MIVLEIVKKYLEEHGYDGLYDSEGECCCSLEELFPCTEYWLLHCEPGYRGPCKGGECDFYIVPEKPHKEEP